MTPLSINKKKTGKFTEMSSTSLLSIDETRTHKTEISGESMHGKCLPPVCHFCRPTLTTWTFRRCSEKTWPFHHVTLTERYGNKMRLACLDTALGWRTVYDGDGHALVSICRVGKKWPLSSVKHDYKIQPVRTRGTATQPSIKVTVLQDQSVKTKNCPVVYLIGTIVHQGATMELRARVDIHSQHGIVCSANKIVLAKLEPSTRSRFLWQELCNSDNEKLQKLKGSEAEFELHVAAGVDVVSMMSFGLILQDCIRKGRSQY